MAIQVSGTTVINDSRALTNITSVDSTTATAIGNAGVGGGMTLLSTTTFSGTYSNIDLTLDSGYKFHRLVFSSPVPSTAWNALWFQLLNSSNSAISSSIYDYNGEFSRSEWSDRQAGAARLTGSYFNNGSTDYIVGHLDVYNARESGKQKHTVSRILGRSQGYSGNSPQQHDAQARVNTTSVCNGIRIFGNGSNLATQSGRADFFQIYGA